MFQEFISNRWKEKDTILLKKTNEYSKEYEEPNYYFMLQFKANEEEMRKTNENIASLLEEINIDKKDSLTFRFSLLEATENAKKYSPEGQNVYVDIKVSLKEKYLYASIINKITGFEYKNKHEGKKLKEFYSAEKGNWGMNIIKQTSDDFSINNHKNKVLITTFVKNLPEKYNEKVA